MSSLIIKQSLLISSIVLGHFIGCASSVRADFLSSISSTTDNSSIAPPLERGSNPQVTNGEVGQSDTSLRSIESHALETVTVASKRNQLNSSRVNGAQEATDLPIDWSDRNRQSSDVSLQSIDPRTDLQSSPEPTAIQPLAIQPSGSLGDHNTQGSHPTPVVAPQFPLSLDTAEFLHGSSTLAQDLAPTDASRSVQPTSDADPTNQTTSELASESSSSTAVGNPLAPSPEWKFDFEPYLPIPLRIHGDIFFGKDRELLFPERPGIILPTSEVNVSVDQSLSDLTENLTNLFGLTGRFQAWKGNFGLITDGLYTATKFSNSAGGDTLTLRDRFDVEVPEIDIDAKSVLASFSVAASYRLFNTPLGTVKDPSNPNDYYPALSMEALAGVRYLYFFQSLDLHPGPDFEVSTSEVKPMLGGTIKLMFNPVFGLYFRGDTSGFGDDNLKQFYNLYAGIDWKLSRDFSLRLAYRLNHIEYVKEGRRGGENGVDISTEGVNLGVAWQF